MKRLFLALDIRAPWPIPFPPGKVVKEEARHITVAFLGMREEVPGIEGCPPPPFRVGRGGFFDRPLFLPQHHPRLVAWRAAWLEEGIAGYLEQLRDWSGVVEEREFLPHLTLCRRGFRIQEWRERFYPLPLMITGLHLYESLGSSNYLPLWGWDLLPPFEEIEHTADIAYRVRGESLAEVERHAQLALAFHFPPILPFLQVGEPRGVEELVARLNQLICRVDGEIGAPFKAVSFHGEIEEREGILEWEMIVDV